MNNYVRQHMRDTAGMRGPQRDKLSFYVIDLSGFLNPYREPIQHINIYALFLNAAEKSAVLYLCQTDNTVLSRGEKFSVLSIEKGTKNPWYPFRRFQCWLKRSERAPLGYYGGARKIRLRQSPKASLPRHRVLALQLLHKPDQQQSRQRLRLNP